LRAAAEICQPEIKAKNLRVQMELRARRAHLYADPARIQQIFWNLISNAIKFTPNGGVISLATCNEEEDSMLRVEVTDTGRGIDKTRIDLIFNAFEQVDTHHATGLGLGLAICKALAGLHGGSIEADSAGLDRGSTFAVTLPARVGPSVASPKPAAPSVTSPLPLRLLVVEDHSDTARTLRQLLLRRGYEVRSAESVKSALAIAQEFPFDVLVSDIGLPDGTGMDLMRSLTSSPQNRQIRGIALSGYGMHEDLERSKAAGFADHLTKPVDFTILDRTLARIGQELANA
jgi:CheY-like chemotaxis protein